MARIAGTTERPKRTTCPLCGWRARFVKADHDEVGPIFLLQCILGGHGYFWATAEGHASFVRPYTPAPAPEPPAPEGKTPFYRGGEVFEDSAPVKTPEIPPKPVVRPDW